MRLSRMTRGSTQAGRMRYLCLPAALGMFFPLAPVHGQEEPASAGAQRLEGIEVQAERLTRDWLVTPTAVGLVDEEGIQEGRQNLQLDEVLNRVPGLQLQNRYNFSQNLRMSIRGFGARAPFGVRGLRILVDGIPETLPDGQSQVDAIDLESLKRIEVIRGPSSALYGNAAGGVVDITTQYGRDIAGAQLKLDHGSHDFNRLGVKAGDVTGPWEYSVSAWAMHYDGYRDHSNVEKRLFNGKLGYRLDNGGRLDTVVRVLGAPGTEDPGSLTLAEVEQDRRQARPQSLQFDGGQSVEQQTVGMVYRQPVADRDEMMLRGFYTRRNFSNKLPFLAGGQVRFDRDFYGVGAQYTHLNRLGDMPARLSVGLDAEEQRDDRQRFDNEDGVRGDLVFDQLEEARNLGLFLQQEIGLTDRLDLNLGLRYDHLRLSVDDRFSPPDLDRSDRRTFREWSYSAGLSYLWTPGHQVYASVGSSFESPTFTEFANPDGGTGFNPDLDPEKAVNYEVGAKGFLGDSTRYEIAVYTIRVRDELVNFQQEAGRDFYENSGRSRRNGVEVGVEHRATETLTLTAAYTYSDFEYRRFVDRFGNDFSGNEFAGVPRQQFFGEVAWRDIRGRFAALDLLSVDRSYAENANDVRVPSYVVANLRLGASWNVQGMQISPYIAVNNLFDEEYYSNIRINTFGGRFYEPAPERNYFVGVVFRPRR